MKRAAIILLFMTNLRSMAQKTIEGEYYFRKMEMASGFHFTKDGKFQFYYTYGAVDRTATGTFAIEGDTLKLRSDKEPGRDFTVTSQLKQGKGYRIIFHHPNKYLLKNILCIFVSDGGQREEYSNENGEVNVDLEHCDSIYVLHTFFPDVPTLIKDGSNNNNRFTLELKPSLEQVSFKNMVFKIVDDKTIDCFNNNFIEATDIRFIKQ